MTLTVIKSLCMSQRLLVLQRILSFFSYYYYYYYYCYYKYEPTITVIQVKMMNTLWYDPGSSQCLCIPT